MGILYKPNSTTKSAQYGINPLYPLTIGIFDVDRSRGQFFPSPEGTSIYVEQLDYPVLLTLIDQQTDSERTIALAAGMEIRAVFKGFTLVHPLLTRLNATDTYSIKLIIGRDGAKSNEFARPALSLMLPYRTITNTANSQAIAIPVPRGARILEQLTLGCGVGVATVTVQAAAQPGYAAAPGPAFVGANAPLITTNGIAYTVSPAHQEYLDAILGTATSPTILTLRRPIILPSYCNEVLISWQGTGLTPPVASSGLFV